MAFSVLKLESLSSYFISCLFVANVLILFLLLLLLLLFFFLTKRQNWKRPTCEQIGKPLLT